MRKRILSVVLTGALAASIVAGSAVTASATKNADGSYTPSQNVQSKTYMFAMPGAWMNNIWKTEENCAGTYWWECSDSIEWPAYKIFSGKTIVSGENIANIFTTPAPADTNKIIFSNHINGGMPSEKDFNREKFDAACQTVDITANYYTFMESDYSTKDIWKYAWDKAAEAVDMDPVEWGSDDSDMSADEKTQIAEIYDKLLEEDTDLEIPEFGTYSTNFFVEKENQDGLGLKFDNMIYVTNLDPNTLVWSYTIVPEGKITYGGEWFFYYGNGEYGTWPTKELLIEKTGIKFDAQGKPVLPEGSDLVIDEYGTVNQVKDVKVVNPKTNEAKFVKQKLMVYGNVTGAYYEKKDAPIATPDEPTTTAPSTKPTASPDPTSATGTTKGSSNNPSTNSGNGSVATGDFSFAAVLFVVVAGAAGVFYFTRKKYNK